MFVKHNRKKIQNNHRMIVIDDMLISFYVIVYYQGKQYQIYLKKENIEISSLMCAPFNYKNILQMTCISLIKFLFRMTYEMYCDQFHM
jgi:hypothetical protein